MYHETYYDMEGNVVFEKHAAIDDQTVHGKRGQRAGSGGIESRFEALLPVVEYLIKREEAEQHKKGSSGASD